MCSLLTPWAEPGVSRAWLEHGSPTAKQTRRALWARGQTEPCPRLGLSPGQCDRAWPKARSHGDCCFPLRNKREGNISPIIIIVILARGQCHCGTALSALSPGHPWGPPVCDPPWQAWPRCCHGDHSRKGATRNSRTGAATAHKQMSHGPGAHEPWAMSQRPGAHDPWAATHEP